MKLRVFDVDDIDIKHCVDLFLHSDLDAVDSNVPNNVPAKRDFFGCLPPGRGQEAYSLQFLQHIFSTVDCHPEFYLGRFEDEEPDPLPSLFLPSRRSMVSQRCTCTNCGARILRRI